jgi:hypothetical protein
MVMVRLAPTTTALMPFHLNQYWQKGVWAQLAAHYITCSVLMGCLHKPFILAMLMV